MAGEIGLSRLDSIDDAFGEFVAAVVIVVRAIDLAVDG